MSDSPISSFWPSPQPVHNGLSEVQLKVCRQFVDEYLFDRDIILAAIRCGFSHEMAKKHAWDLYHLSYTQALLKERTNPTGTEEDIDESDRKLVRDALRFMTLREFPASQVAAVTKLATVLGMNTPKPGAAGAGSVMTVPGIADVDEWEQVAMNSQAELSVKQDTNENIIRRN